MKVLWVFALSLVLTLVNIEFLPRANAQVNYRSDVNYNGGKINGFGGGAVFPPNPAATPQNFPSNSPFYPQQQQQMSNGVIPTAPNLQNRAEIDATFRQNGQLYINGPGITGPVGSPPTNLAGVNANFNPAINSLYRRECTDTAVGVVNGVRTINPSQCLQNQPNNNQGYTPINWLRSNLLQPLTNTVGSLNNVINLQNLPLQAKLQIGLQRPLNNLNQPISTPSMNPNINNNPIADISNQIQLARNQLINQIQSQRNSLNNQMQNFNNQLFSRSSQLSQLANDQVIRNNQMAAYLQKLNQFNAMHGVQQLNLGDIHPLGATISNATVGKTLDSLTNVGIKINSTMFANNETLSKNVNNETLVKENILGKASNVTALLTDNGKSLKDYLSLINSTVDTTSLLEKLLGTIGDSKSIRYVEKREKPVCTNNSCKCCLTLEFGVVKNKVCLEVNITTGNNKYTPGKIDSASSTNGKSAANETAANGSTLLDKNNSATEKQGNGFCVSGSLTVFGIELDASLIGCFSITDSAIKAILE